jgi:glutamate synthase (NADPH/NADH) small chain
MITCSSKYTWFEIPRHDPPKRPALQRAHDFREIYNLYDEDTVREQASRCIQCGMPFCTVGCPLQNRIPEWIRLAAEGEFLEASAISCSTSNLPEICSRLCPQERLCEGMCTLNTHADPVPIGAIERYINEYAFAHGAMDAYPVMPNGKRVAVVGSGPAGIACADELAKLGYAVTVFESLPIAGGLLVNGIPSFKIEKNLVERRLEVMRRRGVVFRTQVAVGHDISLGELLHEFDALFLGMGAQRPKPLGAPGEDLSGVHHALPFLIQKNVGAVSNLPDVDVEGRRVVVVGGGDTAMDCLRTALRSGARDAICVYRRDLANMPGSRKEYHNALEEGATFLFLTNPLAVEGNAEGHVTQLRCIRMELGAPDSSGRRSPRKVPGSEFVIPADIVLVAYGFDPEPLPEDADWRSIAVNDWGGVVVDENLMTSRPKVFSGGDQVRGANLVAYAVKDGRRAARGIHRYLTKQSR